MPVSPTQLWTGGRYLHANGQSVRVVNEIKHGKVYFHDESPPHASSKADFCESVIAELPPRSEENSLEALRRILGKAAGGTDVATWHNEIRTKCALLAHHALWIGATLRNHHGEVLGSVGYDTWRFMSDHVESVEATVREIQGLLAGSDMEAGDDSM